MAISARQRGHSATMSTGWRCFTRPVSSRPATGFRPLPARGRTGPARSSFCRVDMAGNITKRQQRHPLPSSPRFGGACPLWIVHEAAAIPDRILVQLAETPDGQRYVSIAKRAGEGIGPVSIAIPAVTPWRSAARSATRTNSSMPTASTRFRRRPRPRSASRAGICPRPDCDQRAYPPSDQTIAVNLFRRGVVPYEMSR